jgi:hypothetical protein
MQEYCSIRGSDAKLEQMQKQCRNEGNNKNKRN